MEHATSTIPAVETWRPVRDFEGLYEVSNLGRVRRLKDTNIRTNKFGCTYVCNLQMKILKIYKASNGYFMVHLYKNKHTFHALLHRLVAEAFIPNPNNFEQVNHKDENKSNNIPDNLEWCDCKYNINYGTGIMRSSKKHSRRIEQLTLDGQHVAYYHGIREAIRKTNIKTIQFALIGWKGQKTAGRYQWRYI